MVAGLNVIVFTIITVLAHREKIQKKRDNLLNQASAASDSDLTDTSHGNEKKTPLVDEGAVSGTA